MGYKGTVFISGKITSLPREVYLKNFREASFMLKDHGYRVINPAKVGQTIPQDMPYKCYMDIAFTLLKYCDYIYFLKNADESNGSKMEREYAMNHGIKVLTDDELRKN